MFSHWVPSRGLKYDGQHTLRLYIEKIICSECYQVLQKRTWNMRLVEREKKNCITHSKFVPRYNRVEPVSVQHLLVV